MVKTKRVLLKIIGLLSSVRGYNILIICIAQYLAAVFVLSSDDFKSVLLDDNLFMLVLAGAFAIAGGYIINGFYDKDKDLINKPLRAKIDQLIGQNTKLVLYFILNFLSIIVASYVSFRAVIFFSVYIFGLWFYSHKLKRIPVLGNISSAVLAIVPFFAVFIYYRNFETIIFLHAIYVFLLVLIRIFIKDLENLKGDFIFDYQTIPVKYGEKTSRYTISLLIILTFVPAYFLIFANEIGLMKYYFVVTSVILLFLSFYILFAQSKQQYYRLHNLLKFILIAGVFSVIFIHK